MKMRIAKTIGVDDRFGLKQVMGWYFGEVPMSRRMDTNYRLMIRMLLYMKKMQSRKHMVCFRTKLLLYSLKIADGLWIRWMVVPFSVVRVLKGSDADL